GQVGADDLAGDDEGGGVEVLGVVAEVHRDVVEQADAVGGVGEIAGRAGELVEPLVAAGRVARGGPQEVVDGRGRVRGRQERLDVDRGGPVEVGGGLLEGLGFGRGRDAAGGERGGGHAGEGDGHAGQGPSSHRRTPRRVGAGSGR